MGIFGRTQDVLRSNFNALLNRFEEPGRDLAWLLGEMREQVQAAQRDLIRVMGERKRGEARLSEMAAEIDKWEKRAELAVRHGDDALAREALAQKQRLTAERESLSATRAELQQAAVGMKAEIDRMKRTHQEYSARQNTIATQVSQARSGGGAEGLGATPGASNFDAFERIESAIEGDAALATAELEVQQLLDQTSLGTMTGSELDDRFQRLEDDQVGTVDTTSDKPGTTPVGIADGKQPTPKIRIET